MDASEDCGVEVGIMVQYNNIRMNLNLGGHSGQFDEVIRASDIYSGDYFGCPVS